MGELIGKLTNLSYELFGIIIPGAIITLFFAIWLASLGNIPTILISSNFPILTIKKIVEIIGITFTENGFGTLIPLLLSWYVFGHITQWFSRYSSKDSDEKIWFWKRIGLSLILRPPRPKEKYDQKLEELFIQSSKKLSRSDNVLPWEQFFPVAKNLIARSIPNSLISTYQNKYTLHRSITITSAFLFWLDLAGLAISFILSRVSCHTVDTNLPLQILIIPVSIFLVWGFSGGYEFNWKMFGNTVVTEAYSVLNFPKNSDTKENDKPSNP
ncbi:hypothetical protein [Pseudomonas sp. A6]|uniref:hypothetical protein n=1 Tax=Pseudomonas sp. A6 TaxID=410021 RepID=UPI004026D3C5